MPISTDSDEWDSSQSAEPLYKRVLAFLRENEGQAFRMRELSDEILDSSWDDAREQERKRQELSESEYREFITNEDTGDATDTLTDILFQLKIEMAVAKLIELGHAELRKVDGDAFNLPWGWDTVNVVAYDGE